MTNITTESRCFYEYDPDANTFAGVGFGVGSVDDENDGDTKVNQLHGSDATFRDSWLPLACYGFDNNPRDVGDFPSVSNRRSVPMMSERAWTALKPIIGDACEALPVIHPFAGTYFLIHVMRTIDALDVDASEVDRYQSGDKRIARIYRYSFRPKLIEGKHIFKLPRDCGRSLIVDDEFRKAVEANQLRGLRFRELPMCARS